MCEYLYSQSDSEKAVKHAFVAVNFYLKVPRYGTFSNSCAGNDEAHAVCSGHKARAGGSQGTAEEPARV
jgi:hypothetical protein